MWGALRAQNRTLECPCDPTSIMPASLSITVIAARSFHSFRPKHWISLSLTRLTSFHICRPLGKRPCCHPRRLGLRLGRTGVQRPLSSAKTGLALLHFLRLAPSRRISRQWKRAGFRPVSLIVFIKDTWGLGYFIRSQHEQAYLLAKGCPQKPDAAISDIIEWHQDLSPTPSKSRTARCDFKTRLYLLSTRRPDPGSLLRQRHRPRCNAALQSARSRN